MSSKIPGKEERRRRVCDWISCGRLFSSGPLVVVPSTSSPSQNLLHMNIHPWVSSAVMIASMSTWTWMTMQPSLATPWPRLARRLCLLSQSLSRKIILFQSQINPWRPKLCRYLIHRCGLGPGPGPGADGLPVPRDNLITLILIF